jgi:hypothetical protein
MKSLAAIACCALSLIAVPAFGDAAADSARNFVQGFYTWYVPLALDPKGKVASDIALARKPALFAPGLEAALKADSVAAAKSPGEVVGLDFDPFMNSQDPCESYLTGAVTGAGKHYKVEVFGVCSGKRDEKPYVIAEVIPQGSSWVFVNFLYPGNGDLLGVLKSLAEERAKTAR